MSMSADPLGLRQLQDAIGRQLGLGPTSSPSLLPDEGSDQRGETETGGLISFSYGGQTYRVSPEDLTARFTVGAIYLLQAYDPQTNPNIELFGLPEPVRAWILHIAAQQMRPGRYQYLLNITADVTLLQSLVADTNAPGSGLTGFPQSTPGLAGNAALVFVGKPIPASAYQNVTVHCDNQTGQSASLQLYGSYIPNPGTPPSGWAVVGIPVAVAAGLDGAAGVDLTTTIYPFLIAVVTFTTAPTTGSLRIVPIAKRQ